MIATQSTEENLRLNYQKLFNFYWEICSYRYVENLLFQRYVPSDSKR
jgi:hypothetical protein